MTTADAEALLAVQERDTKLDQLEHQLRKLPAREERDAAQAALDDLDSAIAERSAERDELSRRQRRLDDEVETISAKRRSHDERLYGGSVTNARELQDLQEEIEALGRRISVLEDDELAIMEQLEPLEAELADLNTTRQLRDTVLADANARLAEAEQALRAQVETEREARAGLVGAVPEDLLREYEGLRASNGGIGVARLVGGNRCGGCNLTLSAVEVAALRKHQGELSHCEECGRLLVP